MNARGRHVIRAGAYRAEGFTLLEVILALVILGAALAMLSEVMQLASRHAVEARLETQAQSLAATVMDQLLAGAIEREAVARQALDTDDDPPWLYSITIGKSEVTGIAPVEVLIEQDLEPRLAPIKFRLVRWIPTVLELPESGSGAAAGASGQGAAGQGGGAGGAGAGPGGVGGGAL
jgi:prepilin-type N-terminal cleavage/methylation domain-containing protein